MMAVELHSRVDEELVALQLINKPINYQDWSYWSALSDSGSAFSSPIDSELGSSESSEELEDDDYIAELTRKMALYMLQEDDNHELDNKSYSNQEDLLATEKLEKEKVSEDVPKYSDREKISSPSIEPTSESGFEKNPDFEFQLKQALIDKQIQFYTLKQEQDMKQQWGRKLNENKQNRIKRRACGGFLDQKTSHCRVKSDMRAVFLDHQTGSRTGCSGTGVFLPRAIDNTTSDSRRKTGCPTVIIPAKVMQALKLNFDKMGSPARPNGIIFQTPAQAVPSTSDQEMGLPQEWTY